MSAQGTEFMLGEITGQIRELVHKTNNIDQKVDAATLLLARIEPVVNDVADLKMRVAALETDRTKRDTAMSLGGWLLKSPVVGWVVAAAAAAWAAWKVKAL